MSEYGELEQKVILGVEVEKFLEGPVGRLVQQNAVAMRERALEELATADVADTARLAALQREAALADYLKRWFDSAIVEALNALERQRQLEQDD